LYTAGQVAGTFAVIAACGCGKADTSSVDITGSGGPTLVSLSLSPASTTLPGSGTQQFQVIAQWSDGSSTPPAVAYTTTGGTITTGGLYTAPSGAGSYKVYVNHTGGTLADTSSVTVTGGVTPGAWFEEDFTGYANRNDLMNDIKGIYSVTEDQSPASIDLDQTQGYGGLTQSMVYNFPDRSTWSNLCKDHTIGRNVNFPTPVQEVWVEVWTKFSAGFQTLVPSCAGQSSAGYKFLFGRVNPSNDRFHIIAGVFNTQVNFHYPDGTNDYAGPPAPALYFDGQWHQWRMHLKVSNGGTNNGIAILYRDNSHVATFTNVTIARNNIYGLALGRNMNQGPTQVQTLHFGRIRAWKSDPGWGW
jgi:hypothetical protein